MINLRVFVFGLSLLVAVKAQHCTPGIVPNLTLTSDNHITWTAALNPNNCTIDGYVINIFDLEEGVQFQHLIDSSVLAYSLAELEMCKTYTFEVYALTDHDVIGPSDWINGTIPMPANLNLTLIMNNVTRNDDQLTLTWYQLDSTVGRCISYYRVVYWDENNSPVDIYVLTNNFTLRRTPVPCMEYKFQVTAIINNPDNEGPMAEISYGYTAVPDTPKILSIFIASISVNMTWKLPAYSEYRCNLSSLFIRTKIGTTSGYMTKSFTISDTPLRTNLDVFFDGLDRSTGYISFVTLINDVGVSKEVTVPFQTPDSLIFDSDIDLNGYFDYDIDLSD